METKYMKEILKIVNLKEKEYFIMGVEIKDMKEIGKMENGMEKE